MNELKPEYVRMALAWYEVVGKKIGSVTVPYDEIQAISNILREKDAEIERLKNEYEIECETRFGKITIPQMRSLGEGAELIYKKIRAKAITEFAERLKAEAVEVDVSMGYGNECWQKAVTEFEIDQIAKEMKEETNGESDL